MVAQAPTFKDSKSSTTWDKAKDFVKHEYKLTESMKDKYWVAVAATFFKMKGELK